MLSETILQQTRFIQGTKYYHRFLENFPDIFKFAEASEDQVIAIWQGLGYYPHQIAHAAFEPMGGRDPGISDQALMDFGSLVYKPTNHSCDSCQFYQYCLAPDS